MARSKNNKKIKGGFLDFLRFGSNTEEKIGEEPLSNETASAQVIKSEEQNGLLSTSSATPEAAAPVVKEKTIQNLWGLFGGKSKKIKKRKANKTKKSKK
jgi:hypothetical protein